MFYGSNALRGNLEVVVYAEWNMKNLQLFLYFLFVKLALLSSGMKKGTSDADKLSEYVLRTISYKTTVRTDLSI